MNRMFAMATAALLAAGCSAHAAVGLGDGTASLPAAALAGHVGRAPAVVVPKRVIARIRTIKPPKGHDDTYADFVMGKDGGVMLSLSFPLEVKPASMAKVLVDYWKAKKEGVRLGIYWHDLRPQEDYYLELAGLELTDGAAGELQVYAEVPVFVLEASESDVSWDFTGRLNIREFDAKGKTTKEIGSLEYDYGPEGISRPATDPGSYGTWIHLREPAVTYATSDRSDIAFARLQAVGSDGNDLKAVNTGYVGQKGRVVFDGGKGPAQLRFEVRDCAKLVSLSINGAEHLTGTKTGWLYGSMDHCFAGNPLLADLDVKRLDTGHVTSMQGVFSDCASLRALDLSGWNVDKVTDVSGMFSRCGKLETLDLSGWNLRKLVETRAEGIGASSGKQRKMLRSASVDMFLGCTALRTVRMKGCNPETKDFVRAALKFAKMEGQVTVEE